MDLLDEQGRSRPLKPIRAENLSGSQEQAPSQEQAKDPEDTLWQEIEREDQQAAEVINGKAPVFDLFPPPPPRLTAREQKQRAFKLSRRPLRRYQDVDRVNASSRRQAGGQKWHASCLGQKICRHHDESWRSHAWRIIPAGRICNRGSAANCLHRKPFGTPFTPAS
jgi:hypothetical protein